MTKQMLALTLLLAMLLLLIVGLVLVFSAPGRGQRAADALVMANGGSIDTNVYIHHIEGATRSYQIGGTILAVAGLLGLAGMGLFWAKQR